MGFMVGQQYECQDCGERIVLPIEFEKEEDYRAFRKEMLGDDGTEEECVPTGSRMGAKGQTPP